MRHVFKQRGADGQKFTCLLKQYVNKSVVCGSTILPGALRGLQYMLSQIKIIKNAEDATRSNCDMYMKNKLLKGACGRKNQESINADVVANERI